MGLKIYVAGPYSSKNTLQVFENIRKGQYVARKILDADHSPFCPFLDYQLLLQAGAKITIERIYEYSLDWLRVSDAMIVLPDYEQSAGTQGEIEVADDLSIPIGYIKRFRDIEEICNGFQ